MQYMQEKRNILTSIILQYSIPNSVVDSFFLTYLSNNAYTESLMNSSLSHLEEVSIKISEEDM
jgi:hypothetical protein